MKPKFLDLDKIYNLHFNEKIVTPKHLPLQGFVIATLENSFGRRTLVLPSHNISNCVLARSEANHEEFNFLKFYVLNYWKHHQLDFFVT